MVAIAAIHFYLWQEGYDGIDVIGPAFLLQSVLGVGGAALLLITPARWLHWVAALDWLFAAGSLGALLISTTVGLFGFVETTTATLWWETLWVEIAAIVVLGGAVRRRRAAAAPDAERAGRDPARPPAAQLPLAKAASNDAAGGSKASRRTNSSASGAPTRRSMPASSHSTEIGPS